MAVGSTLRFYGSPGTGLWYATTTDGTSWSAPVNLGIQGGDPGGGGSGAGALADRVLGAGENEAGRGVEPQSCLGSRPSDPVSRWA